MGRQVAIEVPDLLAMLMGEDRPFPKREICQYFGRCGKAVRRVIKEARSDGHPVRATAEGIWYIGKAKTMDHLVALSAAQAWAAMQSTAMRQMAIEYDHALKDVPKRLLLEFKNN